MFKQVILVTNSASDKVEETVAGLLRYLEVRGIVFVRHRCDAPPADPHYGDHDLVIAIGGDGTMLRAARLACAYGIPLLGINRGRLGFLADIPAQSMDQHLAPIFAGRFVEETRFLLCVEVWRGDRIMLESNALNDVVLHRWNIARLIEFETYVNHCFVHRQRSDGMIVSSPTGSTAYALSGGGPILHPSLDALVLVPLCPHTLTNRPIVIDGNSRVEIVVGTRVIDHARLTCDGDSELELAPGDRIHIRKQDRMVRLIHPEGHDHFAVLRAKLQWG